MRKTNTTARGAFRVWVGASLIVAIGFFAALPFIQDNAPFWVWVVLAVILMLAILLTFPVASSQANVPVGPESSFIRGDVRNSKIARVDSDAHTFIDGNVEYSRIFDILFKGRKSD